MKRFRDWHWDWPAFVYIMICLMAAIAFAILFILVVNDHSTIKREANIRATQIQQQRYDVTYNNCVNQNIRHGKTIKALNRLIMKLPPKQRKRAEASKEFTVVLIDAIIPVRNCKVVAEKAVQPLPAPNDNGR